MSEDVPNTNRYQELLQKWQAQRSRPDAIGGSSEFLEAHEDVVAPLIEELVRLAVHHQDLGRNISPPEICRECPELIDKFKRDWRDFQRIDSLLNRPSALGPDEQLEQGAATLRGSYRIVGVLGAGGQGIVYRAVDRETKRRVALKVPKPGADPARFLDEARRTALLEHPGIPQVYGIGTDQSQYPCYAMRLIDGETLWEVIRRLHHPGESRVAERRRRPFRFRRLTRVYHRRQAERARFSGQPFRDLLESFIKVCEAVEYAHDHEVIHRDLKPQNIKIGRHGEAVVLDWGLGARMSLAPSLGPPGLTIDGAQLGTRRYRPPEQQAGLRDWIDKRSDIYGLGATLFSLLTGHAPRQAVYNDDTEEKLAATHPDLADGEVAQAQKSDRKLTTPRQLNPYVPRALEAVCVKAISVDRSQRYKSVQELRGTYFGGSPTIRSRHGGSPGPSG